MKIHDFSKDVWLYILNELDGSALSCDEYWYLRGMLDVLIPQEDNLPFVNPLVQYFMKKLQSKELNNV